mgnify:CR=1 FL=1
MSKSVFLYFVFLWALFSFKLPLLPWNAASIRIDDFLIFIASILIFKFIFKKTFSKKTIPLTLKIYILFCLFYIFSSLINSATEKVHLIESILYSIRGIEYLLFFYFGYYLSNFKKDFYSTFKWYLLYSLIIVIFQKNGYLGDFTSFSLEAGRAIANAGGPWEFAAMAAFGFIYLLFSNNKILSSVMLYLTYSSLSRITLLALLLIYTKSIYKYIYNNFFIFCILFFTVLSFFTYSNLFESVSSRYASVANGNLIENIHYLYDYATPALNRDDYIEDAFVTSLDHIFELPGDTSLNVRLYRWSTLIKTVFSSVESTLIGLGPSFAWVAVDGNYIRIFTEVGFLGSIIFFLFVIAFYCEKSTPAYLKMYFTLLVISALMIDIFVTYKAMMLFWFFYGHSFGRNRLKERGGT